MRVRVLVQPTGLLNGVPVPEVGVEYDVDDVAAEHMIAGGWFERVDEKPKVEKRPSQVKAETRAD